MDQSKLLALLKANAKSLWKKQDVIFLAKTYQGNIGKINYSSKIYLDYTLISLLLKNREARNEIGSKY